MHEHDNTIGGRQSDTTSDYEKSARNKNPETQKISEIVGQKNDDREVQGPTRGPAAKHRQPDTRSRWFDDETYEITENQSSPGAPGIRPLHEICNERLSDLRWISRVPNLDNRGEAEPKLEGSRGEIHLLDGVWNF